jgi:hypothetical protein
MPCPPPMHIVTERGPRAPLFTEHEAGHDPADQAVMATRKAVFPLHGLMP